MGFFHALNTIQLLRQMECSIILRTQVHFNFKSAWIRVQVPAIYCKHRHSFVTCNLTNMIQVCVLCMSFSQETAGLLSVSSSGNPSVLKWLEKILSSCRCLVLATWWKETSYKYINNEVRRKDSNVHAFPSLTFFPACFIECLFFLSRKKTWAGANH